MVLEGFTKHPDEKFLKGGGSYSVGGSVGIGEKSGLCEIAEIKGILVLENVDVVVLLVIEN